ncbi:NAD kinase [Microlunatus speluncae]|uniref:NAD kinase n=1 Tax=Microlunatus speluncae TaxID=2594267 RepID=UPI0012661EB8|nr:NAD kinase [Microlunatus speluncae]
MSQAEQGRRRVAVLTHPQRDEAITAATRLVTGLSRSGVVAVLPDDDAAVRSGRLPTDIEVVSTGTADSIRDCELLIVLGGDGTILRGGEWVVDADIPLLGVNLGHVGFLAEAESSEIDNIVDHIVNRSYTVEERSTIDVQVHTAGEAWSSFAINEVTVEKAARERMLEIMVEIDGRPLSRWACDGLVVSTPTGSTAYAFSAGGPVIWPEVEALLLVPLSAHALFARPLVLGPSSRVVVQVLDGSQTHAVVWCDGHRTTDVRSATRIEISQGRHRLRLARLSQSPFTDRLVNKFGLRVEGWRGTAAERRSSP